MKRSNATRTLSAAYCYAARANDLLFFFDLDPTRDRILLAETAVNAALRLRPDSAEAHFAMADFLFRCLATTIARWKSSQSHAPVCRTARRFFILSGYINRRRNHFAEAERDFSTAFALDPRNPNAYNLSGRYLHPATTISRSGADLRPCH